MQLDPKFVFDTFVIASSNRFAHAAAQSVAETPGRSYNPLFIYGDAGLGKTHLLHAIGNYVSENFTGRHVLLRHHRDLHERVRRLHPDQRPPLAFKRRYRECDVLLIDDVQFMENKEALQEEFFHTFNSLYGRLQADRPHLGPAAQVDRHPRGPAPQPLPLGPDHRGPAPRARDPPGHPAHEGRAASTHDVPDDVLEFIATHVKDNIRELEGALIRVTAFASLNRQPISRELAEQVLSDIVSADEPRRITPQMILDATADSFGFTVEDHLRAQPDAGPWSPPARSACTSSGS